MRTSKPFILITGDIDQSLLNEIKKEFHIDVIPFIQTAIIRTEKLQASIENVLQQKATVVFTSANAVEAISEYLKTKPNWKIYCIGNATRILVEAIFGKDAVVATRDDANALAKKIIADKKNTEVYFFCGDKRRNELPNLLKQNNITVTEIEVYTTTIFEHKIEKDYDAVLFFSPSAVNGFFKHNILSEQTVLFSIGNTTAEEIRKFARNKIIISDKPGKKELVEKVIGFFQKL